MGNIYFQRASHILYRCRGQIQSTVTNISIDSPDYIDDHSKHFMILNILTLIFMMQHPGQIDDHFVDTSNHPGHLGDKQNDHFGY